MCSIICMLQGAYSHSLAEWALTACSWFAKDLPRLKVQQKDRNWESYYVEELRQVHDWRQPEFCSPVSLSMMLARMLQGLDCNAMPCMHYKRQICVSLLSRICVSLLSRSDKTGAVIL